MQSTRKTPEKTIVKISGEMKTLEETDEKPKGVLLNKQEFFKLGARKFHFPKYKKLFKSEFFSLFELGKLLPEK